MDTWQTLLESYQYRVYKNTLTTVRRQIEQMENTMHAVKISIGTVCIGNALRLDYLSSEVVLEEHEIGYTDPNIQIDNNCLEDALHFRIPRDSRDCEDAGCGDGYGYCHHVGWVRVERGGAACTLVLVYVSIRLSESQ
jgi:hypothetical protein